MELYGLIGEKERSIIRAAYAERREGLVVERSFRGRTNVRVSMGQPDRALGAEPWLIRMEIMRGNIYSTQYFGCVEEFEKSLEGGA